MPQDTQGCALQKPGRTKGNRAGSSSAETGWEWGSQGRGASGALGPARLGPLVSMLPEVCEHVPEDGRQGERSKTGATRVLQLPFGWW